MNRPTAFNRYYLSAAVGGALVLGATGAFAQGAAGPASQATPLPLSGRTAQGGSVLATQTAVPGASTSVNTVSPTIQVQGVFAGSVARYARQPISGALSLRDAVERGLEYNLGAVSVAQFVKQARGQRTISRSVLLPSLLGDLSTTVQLVNLAAMGFRFGAVIPGFSLPTVVGPFNFVDLRVRLSQTVFDLTAWHNHRASAETVRASELSAEDARDLVVLAVGGTYLQVLAARARVESARAQLETANALYQQNVERRGVGLIAQVDVDRSQIQALTQQQRLTSLENDLAKQKINLVRMIGLQPTDQYELVDNVPFSAAPPLSLDDALQQAWGERADLKAAQAQLRAAERALAAARAERLPSLSVDADYGAIGNTPSDARGTFSVVGRVRVPLWQAGRTGGHIEQAEAVVAQRAAELDDLTSQVESDVRMAYLDLQAATSQVDVAERNLQVTQEVLDLTRQRFDAGITNNVEVVQAQESVATAEFDHINSVFAHNVGKLNLARAIGHAAERLPEFVKLP
jgi:outer membrane protein TolC